MNIQTPRQMDSSAFLAWAEGREERYELVDGRVAMMTGGSYGHALAVRGLSNALDRRLIDTQWITLTSDLAVRISPKTVRYPDVVVMTKAANLRDLTATDPVLVAEVLSPSSVTNDLGDKATEYLHLPKLQAYLVLSQDEPKAWIWIRGVSGFAAGPEVIAGSDGVIRLAALSIELPLAEIYKDFPAPDDTQS